MHPKINKKYIPILLLVVIIVVGGLIALQVITTSKESTYSGTIEATEYHIGTEVGGRVEDVYVKEGDMVQQDQALADIRSRSASGGASGARERVNSPIAGSVLQRLVEPGEVTGIGATLVTLANLDNLSLTVFVPEDRYGQVQLGQTYAVTVDSFPNEVFSGTVSHIADQAEFTPRNVQTTEGRKTTVFAIKLALAPSAGKLKPGMPADVHFQFGS
jgi:multidrug resistance efflux pump